MFLVRVSRLQGSLTVDMQPGKMIARTDKLRGFEDANDMSGTLHWEIGYLYVGTFFHLVT